ncbi:hypothetical protein J7400_20900 [Shimia sp. R9_2]|uniref:hypothetical protein n=1 Tax=Shimia sp. R9_2 TaxID=2821112 RepID=UPI001AD98C52|nr:hypothetical protein [Shimia sp. R9_2]MBO9399142.1 hypothetical protein [Shimia sp. R9_2]
MPIVNTPSADKLNDFALILYFQAWTRMAEVFEDFDSSFEGGKEQWPTEWQEYLDVSQKDFETITNLASQSAELALKAKLCATSPFLLLLGQEARYSTSSEQVDFTDLRTVHAVDLPGAINTFCDTPISDKLIEQFGHLRRLRNKAIHLGDAYSYFSTDYLVESLVTLFSELWPERSWLGEWVRSVSSGRRSFFHDGRIASAHSDVFEYFPIIVNLLGKGQFKRLFGEAKSKRRYFCYDCVEEARTKWSDWTYDGNVKTAHLIDSATLGCWMCERNFPVRRDECPQDECPGNVLSDGNEDYDTAWCHTCGSFSDGS